MPHTSQHPAADPAPAPCKYAPCPTQAHANARPTNNPPAQPPRDAAPPHSDPPVFPPYVQEFDQFCVEVKISTAVGKQLWAILDRDGSGTVSKDEFHAALLSMQASRRWIRFCPSCEYRNDCPFCAECNSSCPRCNEVAFCAACWSDHPGRQQTLDEMDEDQKIDHPFGSVEHLREHLVIRPLEWAYHSKALRPVPVQYKAGLRQLLYAQKKAAADAAVAMNEAALDG